MKSLLFSLLAGLAGALAADAPSPGPPIREVSPGVFEIGTIRLQQKERTVSFPATVNKASQVDPLEYLLVNEHGQTHESLLLTEIDPRDLHFAMLLLGAKGGGQPGDLGGGQINDEFLKTVPKLTGDAIRITVKWEAAGGGVKSGPVEDWIINRQTKQPMSRGTWLYTGSSFLDGTFRAQQEGCFAALLLYPPALINNPRKGNTDDETWAVNEKMVPLVDTPLEITIHLEAAPDSPKK